MNILNGPIDKKQSDAPSEVLRVDGCDLHVRDGELSVTFRISLHPTATVPRADLKSVWPLPSEARL